MGMKEKRDKEREIYRENGGKGRAINSSDSWYGENFLRMNNIHISLVTLFFFF